MRQSKQFWWTLAVLVPLLALAQISGPQNYSSVINLFLRSTTAAAARSAIDAAQGTNGVLQGTIGINTTGPAKALEINSATGANLRLTYNDSDGSAANYADFSMSSGGDLTITPIGGDTVVTGTLAGSTQVFAGNTGTVAAGQATQASDYLVVGNSSSGGGNRSTIRFTGAGYSNTPSNANTTSAGDRLVLYNDNIGKAAIGLGANYNIWFQANGTGSTGFQFYSSTSTSPNLVAAIGPTGNFSTYKSVTTSGWGVPGIYAAARSTAQTAAVASVATYTCGAADGSFEVSGNILVTTSSSEAFALQVSYTDEGNTARTQVIPITKTDGTILTATASANGAIAYTGIPVHIRVKASTAITVKTAGTFTGCTYNAEGVIKQTN
jgi:hypothetical protein